MTDLSAFLLARIAEDEAAARAAGPDGGEWSSRHPELPECHTYGEFGWSVSGPDVETEDSEWGKAVADHFARHDPARVLAACAADRAIVELHQHDGIKCQECGAWDPNCPTLRALASIWVGHAEYDTEWRL